MAQTKDNDFGPQPHALIARLRNWWRNYNELGTVDRTELERIAGEIGLSSRDLQDLVAKGLRAADELYERMATLGLTTQDVERSTPGVMRDLQKTCARCGDKAECKRDLASRPNDPAWKEYCPNGVALEALGRMKGRFPM